MIQLKKIGLFETLDAKKGHTRGRSLKYSKAVSIIHQFFFSSKSREPTKMLLCQLKSSI